MKLYLAVCALLLSDFAFASSLTGAITISRSAVDLERVGTLDWARWPGYAHKARLILRSLRSRVACKRSTTTRV